MLPRKHFSSGAIHCVNRNHIGWPEIGDCPCEVSLHAKPLPQLLGQLWRNFLSARLSQILQVAVHFRVAHQLQHGRLLELDGQGFFQGGIEHGVTGLIGEVGENKLILVRQLYCLVFAPVKAARNRRQHEDYNRWKDEPASG